jgi:hypothetical protein
MLLMRQIAHPAGFPAPPARLPVAEQRFTAVLRYVDPRPDLPCRARRPFPLRSRSPRLRGGRAHTASAFDGECNPAQPDQSL